jgi:hypothetical protein
MYSFNHCTIKKKLAVSRDGTVLLANNQTISEKVVVKKLIMSSRADDKQRFFKEARLLHNIRHKNVVEFGPLKLR